MGVRVRTDEHGFRRPDPATEARRRPGDRPVAALGDSLTFGWGVAAGETWPAHLERLLRARCPGRPAAILNAGIGNSNTAMQRARYERRVRPLAPDWVVVGWFVNDAEPSPVPAENPLLWRSALADLVSTRLRQGAEVRLRDHRAYYGGLHDERRPGWLAMRRALRALGASLARDGAAATLVLLPEFHLPRDFGPFAGIYARVAAEAREAGFEVIDPSPAFPPGPGDRFWVSPTDAHPNAAAQRLFAAAVAGSRFACGDLRVARQAEAPLLDDRHLGCQPERAHRALGGGEGQEERGEGEQELARHARSLILLLPGCLAAGPAGTAARPWPSVARRRRGRRGGVQ
jgi:lysophospholipase L1-like esterase